MIEAFRAVVATGSVSQAALTLSVSQPSVSRLIADLEARLGLMLFDRRGPRLAVRAEALELYDEVEQSFQGLDRVVQRGRRIAANKVGVLTISATPVIGLTLVPSTLALLRQCLTLPSPSLACSPTTRRAGAWPCSTSTACYCCRRTIALRRCSGP